MIGEVDLLTIEECQKIRSVVYELKEFWIQRHPFLPFYTLGLASPYDVPRDKPGYYKDSAYYNSILHSNFCSLYEKLLDKLGSFLKKPATFPPNLALPGFHIFLSDPAFEQPLGTIHCDKSYMFHWQPSSEVDLDHPISFTQAISLPRSGGGMNTWDLEYKEVMNLDHNGIEKIASGKNQTYHPYQIGKLLLHSGHTVHQIAPIKNIEPDDDRITLQGHGILQENTWRLHW